jgi:nitroreductase
MDVILGRRTIRRFQSKPVPRKELVEIVNAGRLAATAGNRQPWQFILVDDKAVVDSLFASLGWLGGTPDDKQRPTALVAVLLANPKDKWSAFADGGAAVQNMQLAAWDKGIGSCWIGSVDSATVAKYLKIPDDLKIFSVLALGYPDEKPVIEESADPDDVGAKRDDKGTLHVKKLKLDAVLHVNAFGKKA